MNFRFKPDEFLVWVQRQRLQAKRVASCYEAGCFGFVLHRKLEEIGVENFEKFLGTGEIFRDR